MNHLQIPSADETNQYRSETQTSEQTSFCGDDGNEM